MVTQRTFRCVCGISGDRDIHAAKTMVEIADLLIKNINSVPAGRRDFKRVEFFDAYQKKFEVDYKTSKHEAASPSGRR